MGKMNEAEKVVLRKIFTKFLHDALENDDFQVEMVRDEKDKTKFIADLDKKFVDEYEKHEKAFLDLLTGIKVLDVHRCSAVMEVAFLEVRPLALKADIGSSPPSASSFANELTALEIGRFNVRKGVQKRLQHTKGTIEALKGLDLTKLKARDPNKITEFNVDNGHENECQAAKEALLALRAIDSEDLAKIDVNMLSSRDLALLGKIRIKQLNYFRADFLKTLGLDPLKNDDMTLNAIDIDVLRSIDIAAIAQADFVKCHKKDFPTLYDNNPFDATLCYILKEEKTLSSCPKFKDKLKSFCSDKECAIYYRCCNDTLYNYSTLSMMFYYYDLEFLDYVKQKYQKPQIAD